jgi:hypothetical protein
MDSQAIAFLESRGYILKEDTWTWYLPARGHRPTRKEVDAMTYLAEEFDWGGFEEETLDDAVAGAVIDWRLEKKAAHEDDCACALCVKLGELADFLVKREQRRLRL